MITNILPKTVKIRNIAYPLPDPFRSLDDYTRANNLDIEQLSDIEIYREKIRVGIAFANLDPQKQRIVITGPAEFTPAQEWLLARLAAIHKERRRRRWMGGWKREAK